MIAQPCASQSTRCVRVYVCGVCVCGGGVRMCGWVHDSPAMRFTEHQVCVRVYVCGGAYVWGGA